MESPYKKTPKQYEPSTSYAFTPCQLPVENSPQILDILKNLFEEKKLCDVNLKVGDKEYGAHRLILSASSDVFQVMLLKSEWNESRQYEVVLCEIPQCEKVFHSFLEYFYTGRLLITHTNVQPILTLADKYIVKSLSQACLQYMFDHLPHASTHNQLFSWLEYFQSCGPKEMATISEDFIKLNFETVSKTTDFFNMDPETMVFLLKQDNLVVYNELTLFNCVAKWLDQQKLKLESQNDRLRNEGEQEGRSAEDIAEYIKYLTQLLMQHIRFPMIKPRDIADLLCSPLVKENKDFFWDKMSKSMELHSNSHDSATETWVDENKHMIQPRLYTSETHSATLSVNNFSSLPQFSKNTFEFYTNPCLFNTDNLDKKNRNRWIAHLYPKGVLFDAGYLVHLQGSIEIPEKAILTVRLRINCIKLYEPGKFKISILIYGVRKNVEHIMNFKSEIHNLTEEDAEINIDDVVPFDLMSNSTQHIHDNSYLIGVDNNELKLQIIITPVS